MRRQTEYQRKYRADPVNKKRYKAWRKAHKDEKKVYDKKRYLDNPEAAKKRSRTRNYREQWMPILKELCGGKIECSICGYNRNFSAIEFHHKDGNSEGKKFIARLINRSVTDDNIEALREELSKCDILCANCHREKHHPEYLLS